MQTQVGELTWLIGHYCLLNHGSACSQCSMRFLPARTTSVWFMFRSPEHVWAIRQFQDIERVLKIYAEEIEKNKADILQQNASQDPAEGAQLQLGAMTFKRH